MTNVPTLGGLLFIIIILSIVPFCTAFLVYYTKYRQLKMSLLVATAGVCVFFLTLTIFHDFPFWIRGIFAGSIAGILGILFLPKLAAPSVTVMKNKTDFLSRKNIILVALIIVLLFSFSLYSSFTGNDLEFRISDPIEDVSYAGYADSEIDGPDYIDILRLESRVEGDSVILEMELAGEIDEDRDAEYVFYIATQEYSLWNHNIDLEEMEAEGTILRASIPVESLENRRVFHVLAVASEYDISTDLNLNDACSNRNAIGEIREILKILTH